jgi:hypothetical protein
MEIGITQWPLAERERQRDDPRDDHGGARGGKPEDHRRATIGRGVVSKPRPAHERDDRAGLQKEVVREHPHEQIERGGPGRELIQERDDRCVDRIHGAQPPIEGLYPDNTEYPDVGLSLRFAKH